MMVVYHLLETENQGAGSRRCKPSEVGEVGFEKLSTAFHSPYTLEPTWSCRNTLELPINVMEAFLVGTLRTTQGMMNALNLFNEATQSRSHENNSGGTLG